MLKGRFTARSELQLATFKIFCAVSLYYLTRLFLWNFKILSSLNTLRSLVVRAVVNTILVSDILVKLYLHPYKCH